MNATQALQTLVEYDRIVRLNETTEAVALDDTGEVFWEVVDTAWDLGLFEFKDDGDADDYHDHVQDLLRPLVTAYKEALAKELARAG